MEDNKNKTENEVNILKGDLEKSAKNDVISDNKFIKKCLSHPVLKLAIKFIAGVLHLYVLLVGCVVITEYAAKSFVSDYKNALLLKKYESNVRLEKIKYMNSDSPMYFETVMKNHKICLDIYSSGDVKYLKKNVKANCEKTKQIIEILEK